MRVSTALRRAVLVTGLVTAVVTPTAPANAAQFFTVSAGNCGSGYRQVCQGAGQAVPVGLSSLSVVFTCTAASPSVVDRTGVGCYLVGMTDGKQYAHTGPFFTVGNQSTIANSQSVPFQGYKLCVGAGYSTATGAYQPVQNYTCLI